MKRYNFISVILPVYNAATTIKETLDSINYQDYKRDFELIIVNDGSKDSTLEIIKAYSFNNRIHLRMISRENKGFINSLTEAINNSQGDIIARIDSDDVWEKNHLSLITDCFIKNPKVVLIGSNAIVIDKEGKFIKETNCLLQDKQLRKELCHDNPFIHSSVLFKKDAYFKTCGYNCGKGSFFEQIADYNLWFELSKHGQIMNIPEYTLKYRFLQSSMSRKIDYTSNYLSRIYMEKKVWKYYKRNTSFFLKSLLGSYLKLFYLKLKHCLLYENR